MTPAEKNTLAWVENFVVRHNICPFAAHPLRRGQVRIEECSATDPERAFYWAGTRVQGLLDVDADTVETILMVFPAVLMPFDTFLAFVDIVDEFFDESGAAEFIQTAHFHPDYRFAGVETGDPANATNRAPYPTLQLLRTESVAAAVAAYGDTDRIFERNMRLLRNLVLDERSGNQARFGGQD